MNIDEHLKALENLATAFTCKSRENIRLEKELALVWERAERMERSRNLYKADNANLKRALDSIAHYVAEGWTDDGPTDWSALERMLAGAGYDIATFGDPEPFIHGDNAEGAEG